MTPYERLEELYATLPTVPCKRLCQNYCGPIFIPKIEAARLEEKRGFLRITDSLDPDDRPYLPPVEVLRKDFIGILPDDQSDLHCPFLQPYNAHCRAYGIRPLVCRVWGMVNNPLLRCPHGCVPTRWVTELEFRDLLLKIVAIQRESGCV